MDSDIQLGILLGIYAVWLPSWVAFLVWYGKKRK